MSDISEQEEKQKNDEVEGNMNIKDNHMFLNKKRLPDEDKSEDSQKCENKINNEDNDDDSTHKINTLIITPDIRFPLVSISVFNELQSSELSQDELENEYKKYKDAHLEHRLLNYFREHFDDEWFKEKYNPFTIFKNKPEKDQEARNLYEKFMKSMQLTNGYNGLNLTMRKEDKALLDNKKISYLQLFTFNREQRDSPQEKIDNEVIIPKEEIELEKEPYYVYEPDGCTVYLNEIPRTIKRTDIISAISNVGSYLYVTLGLPNKCRNYSRFCWITFEDQEKCELALTLLKECKITEEFSVFPYIGKGKNRKPIRITPRLFLNRQKEDLAYTKELVSLFDKDKNINSSNFIEMISNYPEQHQLDILILYLRKVHGFCYYCVEELGNERGLARYDFIHLRDPDYIGIRTEISEKEEEENKEAIEYDRKLTEKIECVIQRLKEKTETSISNDIKDFNDIPQIAELRHKFYNQQTKTVIENEKYQCVICGKYFKGEDFVMKHITNKHIDIVNEYVNDKYIYQVAKENFLKDKRDCFIEESNVLYTIDEYRQAVQKRQNIRKGNLPLRDNRDNRDNVYDKRRKYNDYDSVENRKEKTKEILAYDDL